MVMYQCPLTKILRLTSTNVEIIEIEGSNCGSRICGAIKGRM